MKKILLYLFLVFQTGIYAQQNQITGLVTDESNVGLAGVSISVKGTNRATTSDLNGKYIVDAINGEVLQFSYVGFETTTITIAGNSINMVLKSQQQNLDEVVVIGSRNPTRTVTESAVPIDVISMREISSQGPQVNLNQIMNMVAPSFTSNTQTVADGTDHIDPAQLRGLGPDQVLVLLNGKRRHTSSLVNINGTPGRGSVGTDLNAIPAFAIDKIEVLRDGASAQYGSDAIAGVINLNLKKATNKLEINVFSGANFSKGANDHRGGFDGSNTQYDLNYGRKIGEKGFVNITGSLQFRDATSRANDENNNIFNGFNAVERVALASGTKLTDLWGNINNTPNASQIISVIKTAAPQVTSFSALQQSNIAGATTIGGLQTALNFDATAGELAARGLERRDFNMRVGQSTLQSSQFFINSVLPINDKLDFYMFGGISTRNGESAGFYRKPNQARSFSGLYPNGFLPEIHSTIVDGSFAAGFKGKLFSNWSFDLSNTVGQNRFGYSIENSVNSTLRLLSPTKFNAGGLGFLQNTTNLDITRKIGNLNIAFGGEYRIENFEISTGVPDSYNSYDINGAVVTGTTAVNLRVTDFFGNLRPAGSQVFPGFRPYNEVNKSRESKAAYVDLEYDITKKWMINGAVRYEKYSDFGETTNFKIATLFKIFPTVSLRGAFATGFRAPSLHQIYFSSTTTQFVNGIPLEVGTFNHDQAPTKLLGIPNLKQEESQSASVGITAKIKRANITLSVDGYIIRIKDRILLTDQFDRPNLALSAGGVAPFFFYPTGTPQRDLQDALDASGATAATFFANAIDTQSKGIDFVVSHKLRLANGITLNTDATGTFSKTNRIGDIHASPILTAAGQINRYYSERNRVFLEEAVPRVKVNLSHSLTYNNFDFFLRNVYFGKVTDPNVADVNGDGVIKAEVINGEAVEVEHPIWGSRIITDISIGYSVSKKLKIIIGANNLLDFYPQENLKLITAKRPTNVNSSGGLITGANGLDSSGNVVYNTVPYAVDLSNNNQFAYSRNVSQFGMNGRFLFARVSFKF